MSAICGILSRVDSRLGELIHAMVEALGHWEPDQTGTWIHQTIALGHLMLYNTPESLHEILPCHDAQTGLSITADARIDNRSELFAELHFNQKEARFIPDSSLILAAYRKWGEKCPEYLLGDFAFAIWNEREKQLFCARDHMGCKPFFYYHTSDQFVFATEMKGIFAVPQVPQKLRRQWIAKALAVMVNDTEDTSYANIFRLPPAHALTISGKTISKRRYWDLDPDKKCHLKTESDYVDVFREKLFEAVKCRTRSIYPVSSELSGGLDSSAVASIAASDCQRQELKFYALSHVQPDHSDARYYFFKDERIYGDMVRAYAKIKYPCYIDCQARGLLKSLQRSIWLQDGLACQNFGTMSDPLYEEAADNGIRILLSGFGGDELVSSQAGGLMGELADQAHWRDLWKELRYEAILKVKSPLPRVLWLIKSMIALNIYKVFPIFHEFRIKRQIQHRASLKLKSFAIAEDFLKNYKIRHELRDSMLFLKTRSLKHQQYQKIKHPHVPQRLEYSSIAAGSRRLEYRYPLLDVRLMEFYMGVPSRLKRRGGYGRYLFRRAIEGIVPHTIQWRKDKSIATIPTVHQRLLRDYTQIRQLISGGIGTKVERYLDLDQMLKWHARIKKLKNADFHPRFGGFLNALTLLLLSEDHLEDNL